VVVIDNLSTGRFENIEHLRDHPRFRFAIDTITNEVVMDRLVSECDVIFHLAAAVGVELIIKDPVHVIETNVLGTHAVLKVANRYRKKVLLASTSEIYGKGNGGRFREDDDRIQGPTVKSRWSYATSKAVDEFLGLAYWRQMKLPVVIFRLFNTVGPRQTGQYGMVVPRFVEQALRGEPLKVYGDGRQSRCFCHVEDTIRALIGLAEYKEAVGEVFNVGSTEEVTIFALARKIVELIQDGRRKKSGNGSPARETREAGAGNPIVLIPYDQAYEEGFEDMRQRVPDTGKIRRLIGWEPRIPLTETLRRVIDDYRNGPGKSPGQGRKSPVRTGNSIAAEAGKSLTS
jgi:UDP-glucose 4-epimerase